MIFPHILLASAVPDGRVFGVDQQTLLQIGAMLFNVTVLAFFLGKFLYKPVQKFMQERADKISGQIGKAQEKAAEADRVKALYEEKLQEIDSERMAVLEAARKDAADQAKRVLEDAKAEAAEIRQRAHAGVLAEKERLKEESRLHIIEVSAVLAGKFVSVSMDGAAQDKLFDETMAQLEDATWQF